MTESHDNDLLKQEAREEADRQEQELFCNIVTSDFTSVIAEANTDYNLEEKDIAQCFIEAFKEWCPDSGIKIEIKE